MYSFRIGSFIRSFRSYEPWLEYLAVCLNLAEALPNVDSTGQSLIRTDQLLALKLSKFGLIVYWC